jgi:hypothetical protein
MENTVKHTLAFFERRKTDLVLGRSGITTH